MPYESSTVCKDIPAVGGGVAGAWYDTGLDIPAGSNVSIEATAVGGGWTHGEEDGGGIYYYGPEGFTHPGSSWTGGTAGWSGGAPDYRVGTGLTLDPAGSGIVGRLIGQIGTNAPFDVGAGCGIPVAPGGRLYMTMNDAAGEYGNNAGYANACVTIITVVSSSSGSGSTGTSDGSSSGSSSGSGSTGTSDGSSSGSSYGSSKSGSVSEGSVGVDVCDLTLVFAAPGEPYSPTDPSIGSIVITNTGTVPLTVTWLFMFDGPTFTVDPPLPSWSIAPGGVAAFTVTATSSLAGVSFVVETSCSTFGFFTWPEPSP